MTTSSAANLRATKILLSCLAVQVVARLHAIESPTQYILQNDRLFAAVNKSMGGIAQLSLDGQDLLGSLVYVTPVPGGATGARNSGIGPYLDCNCIPSGFYTPGSQKPTYQFIKGTDSTDTDYAGIVMSETYRPTNLTLEQYWFLRDGETGLHTFSRVIYHNKSKPFLSGLGELRVLFRPNTPLWTHLITNEKLSAPIPSKNAYNHSVVVQDATWYFGNTPNDSYVIEASDYFTKYTFADTWRDHAVHGMFADGTHSKDGSTFGSWLVQNTKETYFGGPLHSDLVVDGIVYNYLVSNHHGDGTPNITDGFDRTFGPQYYYFNKGSHSTTLAELRTDANQFSSPTWNTAFYDSIAEFVPNYVSSCGRTTWKAKIDLPPGAIRPIAVLSQNGVDFQDNANDTKAYQYWADINITTGRALIPSVKAGTYRLTVYAEGIFGQYVRDDVRVTAGKVHTTSVYWREESAGKEIWRIGTPDKSSGEFRHGYQPDLTHPLQIEEYRIYWAVYDFPTDFPNGVVYTVGKSDPAKDFNYVHWNFFGGSSNYLRPVAHYENVNNWTILWDMKKKQISEKTKATLTIQLAGAKTAAGNTDSFNASQKFSDLPYTVVVNGNELKPWIIPHYHSSSCAVRSAVTCYNIVHKFEFSPKYFVNGKNNIVLSLPANGTTYETALLTPSVYVQYDALRLEVI